MSNPTPGLPMRANHTYSGVEARDNARIHMGDNHIGITINSLADDALSKLHGRANLAKLKTASEATYDSCAEGGLATCLHGTRIDLLQKITSWTRDPQGKRILWLCGKAGIGKSTIARTIAGQLEAEGQLGASFFFKRGRAERSDAKLFFPTIAKQLADQIPALGRAIAIALEHDSLLCEKHMTKQFEKLLLHPLRRSLSDDTPSKDRFLVVDALDECEDVEQVQTLLKLLKQIENVMVARVRILITSRPDPTPTWGFEDMPASVLEDMQLERVQVHSIKADLKTFFSHELDRIRRDYHKRNPFGSLHTAWATQNDIDLLVEKSHPLFIVAFTLCKLLASSNSPQEDLRTLLSQMEGHALCAGLEAVYLPVLRQVVSMTNASRTEDRCSMFRTIIGSLILLYDPLSATSLSALLGMPTADIGGLIPPLRSVLNVPEKENGAPDPLGTIKLFHLSFRDFLLGPDLAKHDEGKAFWVDEKATHSKLTASCLRLLSEGTLSEDVCRVKAPGTRRGEIDKAKIAKHLPEEVAYACQYWIHHAVQTQDKIQDDGTVHRFLKKHLLHWVEAMSWLGKTSDFIYRIDALRPMIDVNLDKSLAGLVEDASRFVSRNRYIIDTAPLQIYLSALLFAPSATVIRQDFGGKLGDYFDVMPHVPNQWGAERQKLEGHRGGVSAVAFCSNGKTIASASYDKTIRLWDAVTGDERQKLVSHNGVVTAVAFSPDSTTLCSASWDKTIKLWDAMTGEQKWSSSTSAEVNAIGFSSEGNVVASGSVDGTVKLLDARTGTQLSETKEHEGKIETLALSLDSKTIASGSRDVGVKLSNMATGQEMWGERETVVYAVVFSPDGKTVALGCDDCNIRLYDAETGKEIQRLKGHDLFVSTVAYSSDGQTLVSGSYDRTIRLWNTSTGEELQRFEGHDDFVENVTMSPDNQTVVSASRDKTVRLWNIVVGEESPRLERHNGDVNVIAFSPDGKTVASGGQDGVIKLWDPAKGKERHSLDSLEGDRGWICALSFSHDSAILASGSEGGDTTIRTWNVMEGSERKRFEGHARRVTAIAFSSDSKMLVSGSWDRTIRLWHESTGHQERKFEISLEEEKLRSRFHLGEVEALSISPDGTTIVACSNDGKLRLFDVVTGAEKQKIDLGDAIQALAFSPDGRTVASASYGGRIRIQDIQTEVVSREFQTPRAVRSIRFSRSGMTLQTDIGDFDLSVGVDKYSAPGTGVWPEILLESVWVKINGADFLWLPHEYRGTSHDTFGSSLAIGQASGNISFFSFKEPRQV